MRRSSASRRPVRIRRTTSALVAGALAAVVAWAVPAPAAQAATSPASPTRPLWVWGKDDPQRVVDFAVSHGVAELYVHVTPTVLTDGDLPRLRSLAQLAQGAGLTLTALGGDPAWVNRPADALTWQRAALSTGLFGAAHVDVEPYALAGWSKPSKRAALAAKYVDLLGRLQSDDPLPLEADVPFWYDTVASPSGHGTLADDVLARVDAVTVMSYRDSAAAMVDVGRDVLQRADRIAATTGRRVPVHLAAETNPLSDCSYCTFAEEGDAALRQALDAVDAAGAAYPSYAGTAVHDLTGWSLLRP
ncbi:MAG: hypothetical protein ACTHLJ_09890 [Angustibacter sp.]